MSPDWRPDADVGRLRERAQLLSRIRAFFAQRSVMEVETPLLGRHTVTDPHLMPMALGERYLQTSPEYAMKRLLAAGSGPIYQICKAFRDGDHGSRHNPEFSLLEWYRPGFDHHQLMDEVSALLQQCGLQISEQRISYRELFIKVLDLDPMTAPLESLRSCARSALDLSFDSDERDTWLDLLLSHLIEPRLEGLWFVFDYPASQAALARTRGEGHDAVAERFEVYCNGVELANGYRELTDAGEQARRFEVERERLARSGHADRAADTALLAALEAGLPECAGVALGIDRLLLALTGAERVSDVLSFSWDRA